MKIDFCFYTDYGMFSDSISLSDNDNFSEEEIEILKQERVNEWINIMSHVPIEKELTDLEDSTHLSQE